MPPQWDDRSTDVAAYTGQYLKGLEVDQRIGVAIEAMQERPGGIPVALIGRGAFHLFNCSFILSFFCRQCA